MKNTDLLLLFLFYFFFLFMLGQQLKKAFPFFKSHLYRISSMFIKFKWIAHAHPHFTSSQLNKQLKNEHYLYKKECERNAHKNRSLGKEDFHFNFHFQFNEIHLLCFRCIIKLKSGYHINTHTHTNKNKPFSNSLTGFKLIM